MRVNALVLAAALSLACIASGVAAPKPAPPSGAYTPKKAKLRPAEDRIEQAVNRLIKKADEFWHAGDYEAAGSQYYVITDLDPEYVEGWTTYGWLLWAGLKRHDAAMRVFKRGLEHHPDTWELYFEIAYLEQHLGHFLQAAQWYAKATQYNPPRYVWHARAHALEYAGLADKSKALWKTIIARFPDNPVASQNLKRLEEGRVRTRPNLGIHEDDAPVPPWRPDTEIDGPVAPGSI